MEKQLPYLENFQSLFARLWILPLLFLLFSGGNVLGQTVWTYDFGTGLTTTISGATADASSSFPSTQTNGGNIKARIGSGTGANAGSFILANPGLSLLGQDKELQFKTNGGTTSATKFGLNGYTAGKSGYLKFKISLNGGTVGTYGLAIGSGTPMSDNNSVTTASTFAGLQWAFGSSNPITYSVLNNTTFGTTGITNPTTLFSQSTSNVYEVEIYYNNTTGNLDYTKNGNNNLTNAKWDLWVNGTKVGAGLAKGGFGTDSTINSFVFYHQSSVAGASAGTIYLDDLEYSNGLPVATSTEINIQGNGVTIADGDSTPSLTDHTEFVSTAINTNSTRTYTIQNTGGTTLTLDATPVVLLNNTPGFTITQPTQTTIAPGSNSTFSITFNSSSPGIFSDTVRIRSDDADEAEYTFDITATATATPTIALSSANPGSTAGNLVQGTNNNVIYGFNLGVTTANTSLTQVDFTTTGGYASTEVSNYKLWYSADAVFNSGSDTTLATLPASAAGSGKTFTAFSQTINSGTTGYFFITTDIPCTADGVSAHTLRVNAITTTGLTIAGNKSGTASLGATHTFTSSLPNEATAVSTSNCQNQGTTINWTNASGCRDEVYVFAKQGAFTSAIPTGDGSTFVANTAFAHVTATTFDGGYLIYKGSSQTVSVSGLTNGNTYNYKIFTRNDNNWSNGVTTSCSPSAVYCNIANWNSPDSEITSVSLIGEESTAINNSPTGCTNSVQNYTAQSAKVFVNGNYTISVNFNTCSSTFFIGAGGVWIDWNGDGDFTDANETIQKVALNAAGVLNIPLAVPAGQALGNYRMRIMQDEGATAANIDPCTSPGYGAIEDYTINVVAGSQSTKVNFASATYNASESAGSINLGLSILSPSASVATTANVVLTTLSGTHISTTTYPVTFPANSSSTQSVAIPITQNTACGDTTAYTFEIQNVAGGTTAIAGTSNQTVLTVNDDDATANTPFNETFSSNFGSWTPVSISGSANWVIASGTAQINGFGSTGNAEDYLISSAIDMSSNTSATLNFVLTTSFTGPALQIKYSTNFNGIYTDANVAAATWTTVPGITITNTSATFSSDVLVVTGSPVYFAFHYTTTGTTAGNARQWQVDNLSLNLVSCLTPKPEINIKGNSNSIANNDNTPSVTDHTDFGSTAVTGGTVVRTFTIENTGTADLNIASIISSNNTVFAIGGISLPATVGANLPITFTVTFDPSAIGNQTATITIANDDADEASYVFTVQGTGVNSNTSDIVTDTEFAYTSNINYNSFQSATIPTVADGVGAFRFIIRDGGGVSDPDALGTELTGITFNVTNITNIRTARLYDGATLISSTPTIGGTIVFTGLSGTNVAAADNGTKTLTLYVSFNTTVTDNSQHQFTIASATTNTSGSTFAATNAGGAFSSITGDINRIEVTANGLGFITQPTTTAINVAMSTVVVAATDSNANVDVDFTGPVSIFSTGTLTGSPVMGTLVAGVASFSTLTHTAVATGRMLFVSSSGLITGGSSLFDITEIVYVTGDYRTIGTGNWLSNNASPAIWQRLDAVGNWNPSNSPSYNTTNNVYIRDTHTITATGSFGNGVKLKIMDGGTFDMTSSGTVASIYVYNGGELRVNGALTVVGTFDVENGADVYINAPSANIWGGTENFRPLSNFYIWNWNSAQYLYNNNINPNSSGSIFGNLYIDTLGASGLSDTWNLLGQNTGTIALTSGDLAFNSGQNNIRFFAETGSTANVTVKGNLKLNSGWTSGRTLALSTAGTMNLTVEGNVEIDCPGDLAIKQSNAPASAATLNINGNLVMNGSNTTATTNLHLNFANSGTGGGGKAIVNLKGNLLSNSNASITNSVSTADVEFNFNGISTQLVNMSAAISGSDADNTRGIPLYVKPNAIVQLNSNDLILANGSSLTVETGGTLDFGFNGSTALIIKQGQTGNSAFTSQTESNLKITSPAGIASSGATGNVQTSSRTFGAADYRYVGIANQITGTGLPTSGAKITSANIGTAPTNEVLLTNSPTSVTALDVVSGKFNLNEKTLTGTNLSIANDATLKIVGTATFPTFTAKTFATNSIVEYGGANQVIAFLTAPTYAKLKVSGTGIKTLATADIQVDNSLQVTGCLLKIEEGKTLSVTNEITTVNTNVVPKTDNNVYVAPTLGITIDDGGSLIQTAVVNNQSGNLNTGKINMERLTQKMYRLDYTYWSSPVGDGFTLHDLSPNTLASKYFQWNPGPVPAGNWGVITGGNSAMVPGKGYIIRAPNSYSIDASNPASYQKFTGNFIGKPNNGTISIPVSGSDTVNVWNLLGNPYPSALDADLFLDANIGISDSDTNNAVVGGTLYFWTHNTPFASTTTFNYSASDYASWNGVGSTTTAAAASTPNGNANLGAPNGKIAAGQAFFIKGTANGNAVFNNDMRVKGENMQFFRPSAVNNSNYALTTGKHRIWLNLEGATQGFSQTLVGYITNATNDYDIRFDGESFGGNAVTFYSVNNDKNLVIQGRALPFVDTDEVPMGYKTTLTGNLTISIDHKDGLFDNQLVYLKDNVLNVVHNLSASAYTFAAVPGTFNDRFVLRYLPAEDLANPTFEEQISNVTIRKNDTTLRVNSPYETIDEVLIYDIMGRLIFEKKECNSTTFETNTLTNSDQVLIVKVKLNNGGVVTKKVF